MLSNKQLKNYFSRLEIELGSLSGLKLLNRMHEAHVRAIPFENLDVLQGKRISLDLNELVQKILVERRGGFCYELNYLFYALLTTLGFKVSMLGAQVERGGQLSPPMSHLLLMVEIDNDNYVADVGFGKLFSKPVPVDAEVSDGQYVFRLITEGEELHLQRVLRSVDDFCKWETLYRFTLRTYSIEDFYSMAEEQQAHPDSVFGNNLLCARYKEGGIVTLFNNTFCLHYGAERKEYIIEGADNLIKLLSDEFSIRLPVEVPLSELSKVVFGAGGQ